MGSKRKIGESWYRGLGTVAVGGAIVALGVLAMLALGRQDANADSPVNMSNEQAIPVEYIDAMPIDVPVTIVGYGEAHSRKRIMLSPEVSGVVMSTHNALVIGGQIGEGELVLSIDPEAYAIAVDQAAAAVSKRATEIDRLTEEWSNDEERLTLVERRAELAQRQFDRLGELLDDDVGTHEATELAEQAYITARDEADQLRQRVNLYPIRLNEMMSDLKSAQADLDAAWLHLSKTEIRAPFNTRVASYTVETGQFVQMGEPVAELADDSVLEISTPLDSREARRWLRFADEGAPTESGWFGALDTVACAVYWTESENGDAWTGHIDRVAEFDETSRTVTVVVRVNGTEAAKRVAGLPLVEGMYCRVEIPGTTLRAVVELPDSAVTVDDTVFCVKDGRLETRPVSVARRADGIAYIDGGLTYDDRVIVTRLVEPLERSLLAPIPLR